MTAGGQKETWRLSMDQEDLNNNICDGVKDEWKPYFEMSISNFVFFSMQIVQWKCQEVDMERKIVYISLFCRIKGLYSIEIENCWSFRQIHLWKCPLFC